MSNSYTMSERTPVASMRAEARAAFIMRTYMHLMARSSGIILRPAAVRVFTLQVRLPEGNVPWGLQLPRAR